MNKSLDYVIRKFGIDLAKPSPIYVNRSRDWSLPLLLIQLNLLVGAEVGVAEGIYSEKLFNKIPGLKLYEVDSWSNYDGYEDYIDVDLKEKYKEARQKLSKFNAHFVRDFSMNAVKRFKDGSLDFVYIDAAHDYDHVKEDVREWHKKVKVGGIVAGHDYGYRKKYGVVDALNDWVKKQKIHPLIILNKNTVKSWFYVKI